MTTASLHALLAQFKRLGLDEGGGMRLLGDSNAISDNAIRVLDIADADVLAAVQWLRRQKPDIQITH